MLVGRARKHVGPTAAEDLAQATLVAALENADSFDGRARVTSWLLGILRRKIVDHYRRNALQSVLLGGLAEVPVPTARDSLDAFELVRYAERFARAAPALTERERTVLFAGLDDEDRAEVGQRLGLTRSHLRVVWYRAALKVRAVR